MPFYTPQGGSSSAATTGLSNLTVTGSPASVLVVTGSPATGSNGVVTITMPQASPTSPGYLSSGDFVALSSVIPPAWAVQQVKALDGTTTYYLPTAQTDIARGIALQTALAAQVTGDLYILNNGIFQCNATSFFATGITMYGQGMNSSTIKHDGSSNYFALRAKSSCNISDIGINSISASAGVRALSITSGGSFNNIRIETHPTATIGGALYVIDDASLVQQPKTYLNNILLVNGGIVAGRYQNLDIANTVVLARAEAAIGLNNFSTVVSRSSYYSNSGNFYTIGQLETTNTFISYEDIIINTKSNFAAVDMRFNASSYNINAGTIKAVGTGIYGCNVSQSNSPGYLQGTTVSGGLCSISHTSGGMIFSIGNSLAGPYYGNLSGIKGSTSYDFTNNVPRFHNGTEWTPQYPRGFTLGSYYVPDAYHIAYNSTGILSTTPSLVYTVPTGYKAIVAGAVSAYYGVTFDAARYSIVRSGVSYTAPYIEGGGSPDLLRFLIRGGDALYVSGYNIQTGGTGTVALSLDIVRMPSSVLLDGNIVSITGNGYNTLYTCPNGYNAIPFLDPDAANKSMIFVNKGFNSIAAGEIHYVPSGATPSNLTRYDIGPAMTSGEIKTKGFYGILTPGMSLSYYTSTAALTGTAFTTVLLTPA